MLLPGVSTLRKNDDGSIERIGVSMFGPGDNFCSVWHFFGLLEKPAPIEVHFAQFWLNLLTTRSFSLTLSINQTSGSRYGQYDALFHRGSSCDCIVFTGFMQYSEPVNW